MYDVTVSEVEDGALRAAIEHLSCLDRASCSPGEREAAGWIADALNARGVDASVELERVHGTYWWPLGLCSAAGIVAALLGRRGHRLTGAVVGALGALTAADELILGPRWLRRRLPQRTTANVIGARGDPGAARTVILVAHHDAAHSGFFFDPRFAALVGNRHSSGRRSDPPALMVPMAAAPALAGVFALLGWRKLGTLAALVCGGIIATFVDMAHRQTVPGANDNLTGVATLLGVADRLSDAPLDGTRVIFVSTGAEEALMEGMVAFAERHAADLHKATAVLCVDTVGSPELVLPEAEGMLVTQRYDESLKELISATARDLGIELRRGMTVRVGTDGLVALRRGIPAAMLMSVGPLGTATNYHWPTDTPDRVDYPRLHDAVELCEEVIRRLGATR